MNLEMIYAKSKKPAKKGIVSWEQKMGGIIEGHEETFGSNG